MYIWQVIKKKDCKELGTYQPEEDNYEVATVSKGPVNMSYSYK